MKITIEEGGVIVSVNDTHEELSFDEIVNRAKRAYAAAIGQNVPVLGEFVCSSDSIQAALNRGAQAMTRFAEGGFIANPPKDALV